MTCGAYLTNSIPFIDGCSVQTYVNSPFCFAVNVRALPLSRNGSSEMANHLFLNFYGVFTEGPLDGRLQARL